jgi:hypothetical protein
MCLGVALFSGCELLESIGGTQQNKVETSKNQPICIWQESMPDQDCKIEPWLRYWSDIEEVPWQERKKQINDLSDNNQDMLKKVFLSQGKSTPYQDRLRAQTWLESIIPKLSPAMRRFMLVALYQPSQDLLEMESALVTLSKINTYQSTNIEEQKVLLKTQQNQIEQLLNIETSIIQSIEKEQE